MPRTTNARSVVTQVAFTCLAPYSRAVAGSRHLERLEEVFLVNHSQVRALSLVHAVTKAQRQCPVTFTSQITGGRWKAKIVWVLLRNETLRYSEVRRACPPSATAPVQGAGKLRADLATGVLHDPAENRPQPHCPGTHAPPGAGGDGQMG